MRMSVHRGTLRDQYYDKIYPSRKDVQRYVKAGTVGKEATLFEAMDIWRDMTVFENALTAQVLDLHNLGASWRTIGKVIGTTRQGAQQRYARLMPAPIRPPLTRPHLTIVDSEGRESKMPGSRTSAGSDNSVGSSG